MSAAKLAKQKLKRMSGDAKIEISVHFLFFFQRYKGYCVSCFSLSCVQTCGDTHGTKTSKLWLYFELFIKKFLLPYHHRDCQKQHDMYLSTSKPSLFQAQLHDSLRHPLCCNANTIMVAKNRSSLPPLVLFLPTALLPSQEAFKYGFTSFLRMPQQQSLLQ